jgi:IS5 family transposase
MGVDQIMRPYESNQPTTTDLFKTRLDQFINMEHELVQLADRIDWVYLDEQAQVYYASEGRRGITTRLMVGLHLLKSMYGLSDEGVCARYEYDPYFQYFCGERYFQHALPIDRSSMTYWRRRLGDDFCEHLIQESLRLAYHEGALRKQDVQHVAVDTTVQPKAVTFPTDSKLRYTAIQQLAKQAKDAGLSLRQTYIRVSKQKLIESTRYRHAKQLKRARKAENKLKTWLGRLIRDIRRQLHKHPEHQQAFAEPLSKAETIHRQSRHSSNKFYSWHAPEVECISKGKADRPYEFGCKVSVTTNVTQAPGGHFALHAQAFHGRPYDGHTLAPVLDAMRQQTGLEPKRIYVDKGYRGHRYERPRRVFKSGQKRGVTASIKRQMKRRNIVEGVIGHLKNEGAMGRNYLKGEEGDRINALLAAAGHNFRLLLRFIRELFLAYFWRWLNRLCTECLSRICKIIGLPSNIKYPVAT